MKNIKPKRVSLALKILIAALCFSTLMAFVEFDKLLKLGQLKSSLVTSTTQLISMLFGFVTGIVFIWLLSLGKNWARIIYLIFQIVGTFSVFKSLTDAPEGFILVHLSYAVLYILQYTGVYLLFTGESRDFFRKPKFVTSAAE